MIVIVDYGAGNVASVMNMFRKVGVSVKVSQSVEDIIAAEKLILPGVGAFDAGMARLRSVGLEEVLNEQVLGRKKPVLGICLGAQLLGHSSEEGKLAGLGWVDMDVVRFEPRVDRKVPHMGWARVKASRSHPIIDGIEGDARFYFVHSYYIQPRRPELALLSAEYGGEFVAAVADRNVIGLQFHPEKSHKFGMAVIRNFSSKC